MHVGCLEIDKVILTAYLPVADGKNLIECLHLAGIEEHKPGLIGGTSKLPGSEAHSGGLSSVDQSRQITHPGL